MLRIRKTVISFALGFLMLASAWCMPGLCESQEPGENSADSFGSWVITLDVARKPELNYRGATLEPISSVLVKYRVRSGAKLTQWDDTRRYESLWYVRGRPIGCRRYRDLVDIEAQSGVVRIVDSTDAASETHSLVNAAIRILLDVALRDGMVINLVIPVDLYDQCVSDFSSFSFYEAKTGNAADTMVLLHVISSPPKFKKYLRFQIKEAPRGGN